MLTVVIIYGNNTKNVKRKETRLGKGEKSEKISFLISENTY